MKIINLTPHEINLHQENGNVVTIKPSGNAARIAVKREVVDTILGCPVTRSVFGEVEGLPEEKEGVILLVSALVRNAFPERKDLFSPGNLVRDKNGAVIGCSTLDCN